MPLRLCLFFLNLLETVLSKTTDYIDPVFIGIDVIVGTYKFHATKSDLRDVRIIWRTRRHNFAANCVGRLVTFPGNGHASTSGPAAVSGGDAAPPHDRSQCR